ncbi:hypothetical protein [Sorangium sp. So ce1097]
MAELDEVDGHSPELADVRLDLRACAVSGEVGELVSISRRVAPHELG